MEIPDVPFDPVLYSLVALVVALPLAFLISLALLWIYLRAVKRSMLLRAVGVPVAASPRSVDYVSGQTVGCHSASQTRSDTFSVMAPVILTVRIVPS